jgi:hypothetical protein
MKDVSEIPESPEKQATKTLERKIETFDDLKTSDKSRQIETFDDIVRRQGSDRSIQTFDDIAKSKEGTIHHEGGESIEKSSLSKDTPEAIEKKRLSQVTEDIKKIDWMKPEKWKDLSNDEKSWALRHSGEALGDGYHTPDAPLYTEKAASNELGEYGDGYYSDPLNPEKYVGSDYEIRMNEEGVTEKNKRLFGDDPKVALETFAHEFRHSYQTEQAHAFDKGFITDNPEKAKEWSENLKNYENPPNPELVEANPEKYFEEYEKYRNQPVEKDARAFAKDLSSRIYEENEG